MKEGYKVAKENGKMIAKNPTAYFNYTIEDNLEAGIVLFGTEIKSIRMGKVNMKDTYAYIKKGEVFMNMEIFIIKTHCVIENYY